MRDIDKEKIMDKMRELRDNRDLEFLNEEINNKSSEYGYKNEVDQKKVKDVRYLGQVKLKGEDGKENTMHDLFLMVEQKQDKDGNMIEIDRYYTEEGKCIAGNNLSDIYDYVMLTDEYKENPGLSKYLNEVNKDGILDLNEIEDKRIGEIALELGVKKEDLKNVTELDLNKDIEKQVDEKKNEKNDSEKEIKSEDMRTLTSGKQELKLNEKVDDKKTLGQKLDLKEDEKGRFTKLVIIATKDLKQIDSKTSINGTKYSFVALRNDGTAKVINDKLEVDYASGTTNLKDSIKVDVDGKVREDNSTLSRFKINGRDEYLSVENGQYGEIKAYYGKQKTRDGNEAVETQLESTNVWPTKIELRRLEREGRGMYENDDIKKETEEHTKEGHLVEKEDVDEYPDTVSEGHIDSEEATINKITDEIISESDSSKDINRDDIKEKVANLYKINEVRDMEMTPDYIKELVEESLKKGKDNSEKEDEADDGFYPTHKFYPR